ncbi:DEKNAAC101975 [Brettanomyces naardenensis]|uniref:DEKNAAC101976 n=1 Tax=Brettanomyces naardenensis TaxID=13370 RepID=A0A448YJH9_BRENA|nr:DEKNAAC101975 [Brettanomyces naardenensis]
MLRTFSIRTTRMVARSVLTRRAFTTSLTRLDVRVYGMPAMSPTMDEGGLVSWIVKEGDAFASGDELLEVETDKATMQVDALDDGKLAKIIVPAGTNNVKVGAPIAFLCDEDEDIASLTFPDISTLAAAKPAAPAKEEPAPAAAAAPAPAATPAPTAPASTSLPTKANPEQVFFPSVEFLLEENHVSREDALQKITATGPNGKILRGDVLVYLGKLSADVNNSIASYIEKSEHLDLSHVELAEKAKPETVQEGAAAEGEAEAVATAAAAPPPKPEPTKVSQQFVISSAVPSKILAALVAKAATKAETAAYAAKDYEPSELIDPLFEDLIAPPANAERFTVSYSINTAPAPVASKEIVDEFDFEPYEEPVKAAGKPDLLTTVDVELVCNDKVVDSKVKADVFVSKFGNYLSQIDRKFGQNA